MAKAKEFLEKAKEKLNLTALTEKANLKDDASSIGHIMRATYNIIYEHDFNITFSEETFILPKYVTSFEVSNNARLITLAANVTKETHYFGKPSKYTNAFTSTDVDEMVFNFNKTVEYIDVTELTEKEIEEDHIVLTPAVKTRYHNPRICSYSTKLSVNGDKPKSWTFKIQYDWAENLEITNEENETDNDVTVDGTKE